MASHEFRTPLTIIDGHAQRLNKLKDRITSEEVATRAGKMRAAVLRMTHLIDNLLTSTRLVESGAGPYFHPQEVDLRELLHEVCHPLLASPSFDQPRAVPYALPFGQCVFVDSTFLPGTLTFEVFGHEIELLPRVLIIDREEHTWQSNSIITLAPRPRLLSPAQATEPPTPK